MVCGYFFGNFMHSHVKWLSVTCVYVWIRIEKLFICYFIIYSPAFTKWKKNSIRFGSLEKNHFYDTSKGRQKWLICTVKIKFVISLLQLKCVYRQKSEECVMDCRTDWLLSIKSYVIGWFTRKRGNKFAGSILRIKLIENL